MELCRVQVQFNYLLLLLITNWTETLFPSLSTLYVFCNKYVQIVLWSKNNNIHLINLFGPPINYWRHTKNYKKWNIKVTKSCILNAVIYSLISVVPQQPEPHFSFRYYDTANLCLYKGYFLFKEKAIKNNNNVSKVKPIPFWLNGPKFPEKVCFIQFYMN